MPIKAYYLTIQTVIPCNAGDEGPSVCTTKNITLNDCLLLCLFLSLRLSSRLSPSFSLKLECDKLASEKSEMQRHYIMVSKCLCVCIKDPLSRRKITSMLTRGGRNIVKCYVNDLFSV